METFKSLNILIGVSGIMLLLSLLVTALTHMTVDAVRLRSIHLEQGLADLFHELGWDCENRVSEIEPLVKLVLKGSSVITREDLVETLLTLAARRPELKNLAGENTKQLLADVRTAALQIAIERPQLAASAVKSIALARGPIAAFSSEIFGGFDAAMNRVSNKFTTSSRLIACGFAVLVAVALPLDTFDLFRKFSTNDEARAAAVKMAEGMAVAERMDPNATPKVDPAVIVLPQTLAQWQERWTQVNIAGVCASALLLSLGAPFWFDVLKDLLRLRSTAANQEERDKLERASSQIAPVTNSNLGKG